ncbi:2'-5' RNA ligase superfamily protein [Agrococcus jenensis]|uniref:2'-5' RNA ligase superfamily protein n=2 Tax=Agrococcus jenensis TaxID=46353 RepID=A0A3N2ART0_9MICO|nr:2'-5' RNA ligase superfamily protein [Agrococcus jenensis]
MSSVELLLDEGAEAQVRAEWTALADAGLSSLARHDAASNRPHVTLLARVGLPALPLEQVELPVPLVPVPLVLGPPMLLGSGDRRVLARAVLPSPALLALQATIREAAGPADDEHFLPGRWLPHVTLARRLRLVDIPTALALLGEPIDASAVAIRYWDPATATLTTLASS